MNILLTIGRNEEGVMEVVTKVLRELDMKMIEQPGRGRPKKGKIHPPVIQCDWRGNVIKEWPSIKDACKEGGFTYNLITQVCQGKLQTHRGFVWKYKNDPNNKDAEKAAPPVSTKSF